MRKIIFAVIAFIFFVFVNPVYAQSAGYTIESFNSEIRIREDTSIFVTETIEADFDRAKHGIFRTIPLVYTNEGRTIKTKLNVLSVTDVAGEDHMYDISRQSGGINLKIGDPDVTITGPVTYVIRYTVDDVLQRYDEHDELYWNVVGSRWDTNILNTEATVESEHAEIINVACFAGRVGSDQKCESSFRGSGARFSSDTVLGKGRDMSIVVALNPDNDLAFPGIIEKTIEGILNNWGYLIAILPAIAIFIFWFKKGRDRRYLSDNVYYKPDNVAEKTVSLFARAHLPLVYHPINGLSPAEVGVIIDERVNIGDIVAEIVEMARLGFIKIQRIEKKVLFGKADEYAFIKTKITDDKDELKKLKSYQRDILKELFRSSVIHKSVKAAEDLFKDKKSELASVRRALIKKEYVLLSALTKHFYEGLPEIKKKLYKRMEDEGVFAGDPEKIRKKWLGGFFLVEFFAAIVVFIFAFQTLNFGPLIANGILLIPGIVLAISMPRRTAAGYSLYRQITGLKDYLKKGKWRHEIAEKHLFSEEILPLAISLGVVNKLSRDMKDLALDPPSYFAGSSVAGFSSDISRFTANSGSVFVSAPGGSTSGWSGGSWSGGSGFSGGGSSGGGFGGGGGGSW